MKAKKLDCLHFMPQGYSFRLCPKCIEKTITKALEEAK
jgi:hypothetical protein